MLGKSLIIQNRKGIGDLVIFLPFIEAIAKKFSTKNLYYFSSICSFFSKYLFSFLSREYSILQYVYPCKYGETL